MAKNMKKLAKIVLFSCLTFWFSSFSACKINADKNPETEKTENYATVYITISPNEFITQASAVPTDAESISSAKTAAPVLPDKITYTLSAKGTETGKTTTSTLNSSTSFSQEDPSFVSELKYMLKLPAGTWTVTVTGKSSSNTILTGTSDTFSVTADGFYEKTVPVYFIADNKNKGRTNLVIETTGTNISYLIITGTGQSALDKQFNVENSGNKKIIRISNPSSSLNTNTIVSNNYHPTLTFYNSNDSIVTIIHETINIRNYLATDTWFKTGSPLYLKEKEGKTNGEANFILTQAIIDELENSTLYVKGAGAESELITGTGSDTANDGTRVAPYASLKAALNRVNELNNINYDANSEDSEHPRKSLFTIFCDGDIGGTAAVSELTLSPENNLNLLIQSIDSTHPATVTTPVFTLTGTKSNNITIKDINIKGDIVLENGNLILDSSPVLPFDNNTKGAFSYAGGQLTLGGTSKVSSGITLNAAEKKIYIDNTITATTTTKIYTGTNVASSYTESSVILEGTGSITDSSSYKDISVDDLSKFFWVIPEPISAPPAGETDAAYYSLRLKTIEGKQKAILGKTLLSASDLPIWDDISFVLEGYDSTGSSLNSTPPKYEYKITGHSSSADKITGSITIKMYVKKGDEKLKLGTNTVSEVTLDELSLSLYGDSSTPIAPTTDAPCIQQTITPVSSNESDYTQVSLTCSGIRPGVYLLKMSAVIDGIPYSQQSAAIYASLGAN